MVFSKYDEFAKLMWGVPRALDVGTSAKARALFGAAETFASLQRGERVTEFTPDTVCDGLRGTLGAPNFALLQRHGVRVLTATDTQVVAAMRLLWQRGKLLVEPSSAVALAIVLAHPAEFAGKRVGIILSGGNVDLDALPALFAPCAEEVP